MAATKGSKDDNEDSDEHDGAGLQGAENDTRR